jgi:hypothetical protein
MLPPNVSVFWVDESDQSTDGYAGTFGTGFEDIDHPTAEEINAGLNISCALTTDLTLGWTDRDTDTTKGLCDDSNVSSPTAKNYEGALNFFLDKDPNKEEESVYNEALETFKKPLRSGYLVQRIGKNPRAQAEVADEDRVTIFKFLAGDPNIQNDASAPIQMAITFYPQGESTEGIVQVGSTGS